MESRSRQKGLTVLAQVRATVATTGILTPVVLGKNKHRHAGQLIVAHAVLGLPAVACLLASRDVVSLRAAINKICTLGDLSDKFLHDVMTSIAEKHFDPVDLGIGRARGASLARLAQLHDFAKKFVGRDRSQANVATAVACARLAAVDGPFGWKTLAPCDGLPELQVLLTSDEDCATNFLKVWDNCTTFGLDLEYRPVFQKDVAPPPSALVQIASGSHVLLFDLHEYRRNGRTENLPAALEMFLEDDSHTFYGMGLTDDLVRLAFEFDIVCRGVDFASPGQTWPALTKVLGGGLVKVTNRVVGTCAKTSKKITMSNWERRPLSDEQLQYAANDAFLSWALADHFLKQEAAREEWLISKAVLYKQGMKLVEKGLRCPAASKHLW